LVVGTAESPNLRSCIPATSRCERSLDLIDEVCQVGDTASIVVSDNSAASTFLPSALGAVQDLSVMKIIRSNNAYNPPGTRHMLRRERIEPVRFPTGEAKRVVR